MTTNDMRANVAARRGSITATATSDNCATIHTVMIMRMRPCQNAMRRNTDTKMRRLAATRGFARRSIDGVVLRLQLEQLVEEAEVDAQVRQHAPRHERGAGKIGLWLAAKIAVRKIASRPVRPSMMPLISCRSRNLSSYSSGFQR